MSEVKKKSLLDRILDSIERAGNRLPDPITLFLYLSVFVIIISAICSRLGVSAINPADGETIEVFNLFSSGGIQYLWTNIIANFSGFAPLGMVLIALVGSAVAEKSGFLIAFMQSVLGGAKGWIVTFVVIFVGINLNVAGDAGFIILPPLAAILFMSIGRHPLLGVYVAFAAVAAGFAGNLLLGLVDALVYGFTEPAAQMIDSTYSTSMAINWYFLIASCILLSIAGTVLVETIMTRRFVITKEELTEFNKEDKKEIGLSAQERKGLICAGIGFAGFVVMMLLLSLPVFSDIAILADETGSLTASSAPFTKGIVFTVTLGLFVPGLIYGIVTGKYKTDKQVWADISLSFSEMGSYIFMCFFISIFTNFFAVTNLGTILAINGASFLGNIGFQGIPLMIGLIILSAIVNLFIGSASAKWAILAPVFVPMMMLMDYDPAVTQLLYRIGDSITNPLSPLFTYMPVALGFVQKYKKDAGLGTLIANMIPFSVTFAIVWVIQLILWVVLNLPLGPGGGIYL